MIPASADVSAQLKVVQKRLRSGLTGKQKSFFLESFYLKQACRCCQMVLTAAVPQDLLLCLFLKSSDQISASSGPVSGVFLFLK